MGVPKALIPAFSQREKGLRVWHGNTDSPHPCLLPRGKGGLVQGIVGMAALVGLMRVLMQNSGLFPLPGGEG
ncbi:hypothetical protein BIY31_22985 [Gibbsiella quercinecans]|nr:hypothetical protein BIY31_22985 [Gibbsiella quercinecans]